ncbi:unnamed protein product [Trichobilharzia regenti]|nr:unnamed protein product [Trichobilharzia regenti]
MSIGDMEDDQITEASSNHSENGDTSNEMMEVDECHVKNEVYIPGRSRPLEDDEELIMDKSAYRMFFELEVEYSSLSFDILTDNMGSDRRVEESTDEGQSSSEDESDSDEEDLDAQPDVEAATILHHGTVNRVRAKRQKGRYLAASWSENGMVSVIVFEIRLSSQNVYSVQYYYIIF